MNKNQLFTNIDNNDSPYNDNQIMFRHQPDNSKHGDTLRLHTTTGKQIIFTACNEISKKYTSKQS